MWKPLDQSPCSNFLPVSENDTPKHLMYPSWPGTLVAVTNRIQMTSFTSCSWFPIHAHTYTEIQHKCSNNKRPLLHSFHHPQWNPSTLLFYNSRFQRIPRILVLSISGEHSHQPRPQKYARMLKSSYQYSQSSQSTDFYTKTWFAGKRREYLPSLKVLSHHCPDIHRILFSLVSYISAVSVKVQRTERFYPVSREI